jgi:hypothetical protein
MALNLPLDECIDNTNILVIKEKSKRKEMTRINSNKRSKAKQRKKEDHLKEERPGPLRQGQRLDTTESKTSSSKEHKPPKHTRAPPTHMHTPREHVPSLGTNRSDWFPKLVRPVPPNRSERFNSADHAPKAKKSKEMHKLPLDCCDRV